MVNLVSEEFEECLLDIVKERRDWRKLAIVDTVVGFIFVCHSKVSILLKCLSKLKHPLFWYNILKKNDNFYILYSFPRIQHIKSIDKPNDEVSR